MADKDKRRNKKLDRIQGRLDRGMKSKRQAERNLDRAEKITHKANKAGNFETYNRATTVADQALDQYANFEDSSKSTGLSDGWKKPTSKKPLSWEKPKPKKSIYTAPFYKTGKVKSPLTHKGRLTHSHGENSKDGSHSLEESRKARNPKQKEEKNKLERSARYDLTKNKNAKN